MMQALLDITLSSFEAIFVGPVAFIFATLMSFGCVTAALWPTTGSFARREVFSRQCSHIGQTPRCGGLAVFCAMIAAPPLVGLDLNRLETLLPVSALPVFILGAAEDMTGRIRPRDRAIASAAAAGLALMLLNSWVQRADLPVLETLMLFPVIAAAATIGFSAGFCHAVNLTDGMHGMAASIIIAGGTGLAMISAKEGNTEIALMSLTLSAATAGFLVLNWPAGRLFLGDAGAYTIGHILIWLAVLLVSASENVAVPAVLLIVFWPLAETAHTVFRRWASGNPIARADRLHMHHVLRRALEIRWLGRGSVRVSNPLTTLLLLPFILAPVAVGVYFYTQPVLCWLILAGFVTGYFVLHKLLMISALRYRRGRRNNRFHSASSTTVRSPLARG